MSPKAWAKMCLAYDHFHEEVSGYCTLHPDDDFLCTDLVIPKQVSSPGSTDIDVHSLGNLLMENAAPGTDPFRNARVWFHTHPNMEPGPSSIDWAKFNAELRTTAQPYFVMIILGKERRASCTVGLRVPHLIQVRAELVVLSSIAGNEEDEFLDLIEERVSRENVITLPMSNSDKDRILANHKAAVNAFMLDLDEKADDEDDTFPEIM